MRISDWSSDVCSSDLEFPERDADRPRLAVAQDAQLDSGTRGLGADEGRQVAGLADVDAVDRPDHVADPQACLLPRAARSNVVDECSVGVGDRKSTRLNSSH